MDVANDLLSKCYVKLRLRKLTDCDASVFIALYESILGEKVPGNTNMLHIYPVSQKNHNWWTENFSLRGYFPFTWGDLLKMNERLVQNWPDQASCFFQVNCIYLITFVIDLVVNSHTK